MSEDLNPCPFCGKSDKVTIYSEAMTHHGELLWIRYGVKCKRCYFGIPTYAKKQTAIRNWNTRPAEDALKAENERLKEDLQIQKNLTRQQCFLAEEAFKEADKLKKMFYNLVEKQAKVSTNVIFIDTGKGGEDE